MTCQLRVGFIAVSLLAGLALAACAPAAAPAPTAIPTIALPTVTAAATVTNVPPVTAPAEDAAKINAALEKYRTLTLAMDSAALAAMFAPDGVLDNGSGAPLQGPDAIRTFLSSFSNVQVLSNTMTADSLKIDGSTAVQTGTFEQRAKVGSNEVTAKGTFEIQWAKQPDGRWLIQRAQTR